MNRFTIIKNKVFVAVPGGVVIFDTQSPWDRRYIPNHWYDEEYPTPNTKPKQDEKERERRSRGCIGQG